MDDSNSEYFNSDEENNATINEDDFASMMKLYAGDTKKEIQSSQMKASSPLIVTNVALPPTYNNTTTTTSSSSSSRPTSPVLQEKQQQKAQQHHPTSNRIRSPLNDNVRNNLVAESIELDIDIFKAAAPQKNPTDDDLDDTVYRTSVLLPQYAINNSRGLLDRHFSIGLSSDTLQIVLGEGSRVHIISPTESSSSSLQNIVTLPNAIQAFCLNQSASCVAAVDDQFLFHIISMKTQTVACSFPLQRIYDQFESCSESVIDIVFNFGNSKASSTTECLTILFSSGHVLSLSNIPIFDILKEVGENKRRVLGNAMSQVVIRKLVMLQEGDVPELYSPILQAFGTDVLVANAQGKAMSRWKAEDTTFFKSTDVGESMLPVGISRLLVSRDCRFIVLIDNDGALSWWDAADMVRLYEEVSNETTVFQDVVFIASARDDERSSSMAIATLSVPRSSSLKPSTPTSMSHTCSSTNNTQTLTVWEQCQYRLEFQSVYSSCLGSCDASTSSRMFMKQHSDNFDGRVYIVSSNIHEDRTEMEFIALYVADANYRVSSMMARGNYEQAAALANATSGFSNSNNNVMMVSLSQLERALREDELLLPELKVLVDKTTTVVLGTNEEEPEDLSSIATIVIENPVKDIETNFKLMQYVVEKLSCEDSAKDVVVLLQSTLYRLTTFCLISEAQEEGVLNVEAWHEFRTTTDLLSKVMKRYMSYGSIRAVKTIWRRHRSEETGCVILDILDAMQRETPPSTFVNWLKTDVSPFITPESRNRFYEWIFDRASQMVVAKDVASVKNAILLTSVVFTSNTSTKSLSVELSRSRDAFNVVAKEDSENNSTAAEQSLFSVVELHKNLVELSYLQLNHRYESGLDEFLKSSYSDITYVLLDRVTNPDLVSSEIRVYIKPYTSRHRLDLSHILYQYIMKQKHNMRESLCIAFINAIASDGVRAEATLGFLRRAKAPYSAAVLTLAKESCKEDRSFSESDVVTKDHLTQQTKLMELQGLFSRYGIKTLDIADLVKTRRLLSHIVSQVDNLTAFDDAMQLVSASSYLNRNRTIVLLFQNIIVASRERDVDTNVALKTVVVPHILNQLENKDRILDEVLVFGLEVLDRDSSTSFNSTSTTVDKKKCFLVEVLILISRALSDGKSIVTNLSQWQQLVEEFNVDLSLSSVLKEYQSRVEIIQGAVDKICKSSIPHQPAIGVNSKGKKRKPSFRTSGHATSSSSTDAIKVFNSNVIPTCRKLAKIFQITATDTLGILSITAAKYDFIDECWGQAQKLLSIVSLGSSTTSDINVAIKWCIDIATELSNNDNSKGSTLSKRVSYVEQLLQHAALLLSDHSCPALRSELVDKIRAASVLREVYNVTEAGSVASSNSHSLDSNQKWYRSDAVILDTDPCMKVASLFCKSLVKFSGTDSSSTDSNDATAVVVELEGYSRQLLSYLVEHNATQLVLIVLCNLRTHDDDDTTIELMGKTLTSMVSKVLQSPAIDNDLVLGYLLSMDQRQAFESFRTQLKRESVYQDYSRLQTLAAVGKDAARAWSNIGFLHSCSTLQSNAKWWHFLNTLEIPCETIHFQLETRDTTYLQSLIPEILSRTNNDLQAVLEFAGEYNIGESVPCILYVEALLMQENDDEEHSFELFSSSNSNSTIMDYQDKIAAVLDDIHDLHLVKLLTTLLPKISGLNYSKLYFVLGLLTSNRFKENDGILSKEDFTSFAKHRDVLCVLSSYTPRINFHSLLADPWAILEPELTMESVSQLVVLCSPLDLDPDEFYMHVAKSMASKLKCSSSTTDSTISTNNSPKRIRLSNNNSSSATVSFQPFQKLLENVRNVENAALIAEWISETCLVRDQRLRALEFALNVLQSDEASSGASDKMPVIKEEQEDLNTSFESSEMISRVQDKITKVKVGGILSTLSLATDAQVQQLLQEWSDRPDELIVQAYKVFTPVYANSSEASSSTNTATYSASCQYLPTLVPMMFDPAVHSVMEEVEAYYEVPNATVKARQLLIKYWLADDARPHTNLNTEAENSPIHSIFKLDAEEVRAEFDTSCVLSIVYLMAYSFNNSTSSTNEFSDLVGYLIQYSQQNKSGVTFRSKSRALRAVLKIASPDVIQSLSGISYPKFLSYVQHCSYMIDFEEMRFPQTLQQVLHGDKMSLLRGLWRQSSSSAIITNNQQQRRRLVTLVSRMALEAGIADVKLWKMVLSQMEKQNMYRQLLFFLSRASNNITHSDTTTTTSIWYNVIRAPIKELLMKKQVSKKRHAPDSTPYYNHYYSVESIKSIFDLVLSLVRKCPCMLEIDVPDFVKTLQEVITTLEEGDDITKVLSSYVVRFSFYIPFPAARALALKEFITNGSYLAILDEVLAAACVIDQDIEDTDSSAIVYDDGDAYVVHSVFEEIHKTNSASVLNNTPFAIPYSEYLNELGLLA